MKRSEMLRIIWEAINELEDADHILTRMEKEGMLPPLRTFEKMEWHGGGPHEWDPEEDG